MSHKVRKGKHALGSLLGQVRLGLFDEFEVAWLANLIRRAGIGELALAERS